MNTIITIDGPVASGKSTIARLLAKQLGFNYLTSGLLYRGIAYAVLQDYPSCVIDDQLLANYLQSNNLSYRWTPDGESRIFWQNVDITPLIKTPTIDACAARLAQQPIMREYTLSMQRTLAQGHAIIAEGRDLGSVIFPHAPIKFFLTADLQTRAQRWQELQQRQGIVLSLEEAERLINQRDESDSQRKLAPLIVPENAIIIDTSNKNIEIVVQEMLEHITRILQQGS